MHDSVIAGELGAVPDAELLDVLKLEWRGLARQQARVWAVLAELATRDPRAGVPGARRSTPGQVMDAAVEEVRAELMLTRRSAAAEVEHAVAVAALPQVAAAVAAGWVDRRRAIVLTDACTDLTPDQAQVLVQRVLPEAARCTASGLAQRARRVAVALDPGWAERRYHAAVHARRVIGYLAEDGSATLTAHGLDVYEAAAAGARVSVVAEAAKRGGATATLDQLRADVFIGLLTGHFTNWDHNQIIAHLIGAHPPETHSPAAERPAHRPTDTAHSINSAHSIDTADSANSIDSVKSVEAVGVHVRVGLATLLGRDEHPGDLPGWGTITAATARAIVARQPHGEWRYAIHDTHGRLLFDGTTRHRPHNTHNTSGTHGTSGTHDTTGTHDTSGTHGASGRNTSSPVQGGIVELLVPDQLLTDTDTVARQHPGWAAVLVDLARQYTAQQRPAQDPTARFPGRPLRRHTQTRYTHCLFPGCRHPATHCQLDHRRNHATGGRTEPDQLAPLCGHDHTNKTERGWRLTKLDNHTFRWTSPLGRHHHVHTPPITEPLPTPIPRPPPETPPF